MAIATASEVRSFLEGYEVTDTQLSDSWIQARIDNFVQPWVEKILRRPLESEEEITEYVSGTGRNTLVLSNRNINELIRIEYVTGGDIDSSIGITGVELIADEGVLRSIQNISEGRYNSVFAKGERNIKVTYKVGYTSAPADIKEAIIYLSAEQILGFIGARTGGGSLNVEGFGRSYGSRGKYQDIRNDLTRQAMAILKQYMTSVVGNI